MSAPQLRISGVGNTWLTLLLVLQVAMSPAVTLGFGINLMQVPSEEKSQATCTLALLQKYFHSGDALSGAVLCVSVTPNTPNVLDQLMRALNLHQDYQWTLLVTSPRESQKSESNVEVMHEKPQCYFLIVEDLDDEDLEETFAYWRRMLNWNPLAQFVVYLSSIEETDEEMTDLMVEILLSFMSNKLYNVNVFGQSEENSFYYSKTVFPYKPDNNCGNRVIDITLLDACSYEDAGETDEQNEDYDDEETSLEQKNADESNERMGTEDSNQPTTNEDKNVTLGTSLNSYAGNYVKVTVDSEADSQEVAYFSSSSNENDNQPETRIDEFTSGRFEVKFPRDLSGCPIRAAYRGPWEPYIFTTSTDTNEPEIDYYEEESRAANESYVEGIEAEDYTAENMNSGSNQPDETMGLAKLAGIEYQLVQTIAHRLHMNIDFKMKSSNVFHIFQQLIEGQTEMIVGGIDEDPSISQFVSRSSSYHQDELTWCVARAKRKHSFFNFLAGFDASTWLLLLLFIIISSLAVLVAQHVYGQLLPNNQRSYLSICLRMLGILLTQAINGNARSLPIALRLLFFTAFILAFFFSNSFQSCLISTLTTPTTQTQISALEEIYGKRMTIMVSSENVRHLNREGETFKYIREKFDICYNIVECLNYAADSEHIAVAVSRQHAFYNPHIQRNKLYCFDRRESLYVYPVAMLLPKKFHLLHHINAVIQHVIESGHMQKWARDLDMVRMIQEKIARAHEDAFKALTLAAFQGAFVFASLLLVLACGVFAWECLVYWLVIRWRTRLRLLRFVHRRLGRI